jgi:hypothetical protein
VHASAEEVVADRARSGKARRLASSIQEGTHGLEGKGRKEEETSIMSNFKPFSLRLMTWAARWTAFP